MGSYRLEDADLSATYRFLLQGLPQNRTDDRGSHITEIVSTSPWMACTIRYDNNMTICGEFVLSLIPFDITTRQAPHSAALIRIERNVSILPSIED